MRNKIEICKICDSKLSNTELITDFIYGDKTKKKNFLNVSHVMLFIKSLFLKKKRNKNFINKNLKNLCPPELEKILDG